MTDTVNTRRLALDVLLEVTAQGAYSNQVLRAVLEKYQYMEKYERAFLTRLVEGTIQHMIELDYVIDQFSKVKVKKMKPVIRNILRMGVYQIQYMDSVPDSAACNEAVKLARKSGFSTLSGFVNGVLRNIARNSGSIRYPDEEKEPVLALSVRYSMPEWIVEEWLNAYGMEQTKAILDAFSKEAPITIRTNVTKITPDALKEQLKAEGVTVQTLEELSYAGLPYTDAYHYAFAISGFDHLMALPSFKEGLFYVQDISSMMVAETAAPGEGAHVIDVCAAPGGKSIHLAEMLNGTGSVEAVTWLEAEKSTNNIFFTVGNLDYLIKGGRIGKVSGRAANLLGIKPMILFKDGEIFSGGVARGRQKSFEKALEQLMNYLDANGGTPDDYRIIVGYGYDEEEGRRLWMQTRAALRAKYPAAQCEVGLLQIGSTIAVHTGPYALGMGIMRRWKKQ